MVQTVQKMYKERPNYFSRMYTKQVSQLTYSELCSYIGQTVRMMSDCDMFPNFDVTGEIQDISIRSNIEYIITIYVSRTENNVYNKRQLQVGSNMSNLTIESL